MKDIKPRSEGQAHLLDEIDKNQFTIVTGFAGTGKTFLTLYKALKLVRDAHSKIRQIIVIRPFIKNKLEHDFGALPGTVEEKMGPLGASITDNLKQIYTNDGELHTLLKDGVIEFSPLSLLRGRSLEGKFVIVEEAQNLKGDGVYTVMSRIGRNSKCVFCGDPMQADVHESESDLARSAELLSNPPLRGVGVVQLYHREDIQRNPLLFEIMKRFGKLEHREGAPWDEE